MGAEEFPNTRLKTERLESIIISWLEGARLAHRRSREEAEKKPRMDEGIVEMNQPKTRKQSLSRRLGPWAAVAFVIAGVALWMSTSNPQSNPTLDSSLLDSKSQSQVDSKIESNLKNLKSKGAPASAGDAKSSGVDFSADEAAKGQAPGELQSRKLDANELLASHQLVSVLMDVGRKDLDLRAVLQRMREVGLRPDARREVNPVTGRSYIIRSATTLPGTRYFHAQVFENSRGGEFVQHISFDLRPGADSMTSAISIVRGLLPPEARQVADQADFKAWTLGNGYMAWVKVLNSEDMQGDPYDAYSFPSDRGTIKIAIEEDVEDQRSVSMD